MTKTVMLLALILTIVVTAGVNFYWQRDKQPKPGEVVDQSITHDVGEDELGYQLVIPDKYEIEETGQFSRRIFHKLQESGVGQSSFIYISVIPIGKDFSPGEIYNYSKDELKQLIEMKVGEKKTIGNISRSDLVPYFQFTRIEDAMMGGYGAKSFVNNKPWEFPPGTSEYRYIVPFAQATYLIGVYVNEDLDVSENITLTEFNELISNFKITPDTFSIILSSPVSTGEWVKFKDNSSGISLEYPSGWTRRSDEQSYQEGNMLTLTVVGQTQRPQTELYDGVSFVVMKPVQTSEDVADWVQSRYGTISESNEEVKYSSVSYAGRKYEKVTSCGLGCFTYYHTSLNGNLYGFILNAVGPHATTYLQAVDKIMSSVKYD